MKSQPLILKFLKFENCIYFSKNLEYFAMPARFRFASSRCGLSPYTEISGFRLSYKYETDFSPCSFSPCQLDSASLLLAAGSRPIQKYPDSVFRTSTRRIPDILCMAQCYSIFPWNLGIPSNPALRSSSVGM